MTQTIVKTALAENIKAKANELAELIKTAKEIGLSVHVSTEHGDLRSSQPVNLRLSISEKIDY